MLSFKEQFHATQLIIDKGLYKDQKWVTESMKSLSDLKKLWPKEGTSYDISEITGHPEWYVDQISYWCFVPEETLKIELESHGSLKLNYLLQYLEVEEEEKIIEQLSTARTKDATAEHITDNLFDKFLEDSRKTKKKLTPLDLQVQQLKELDVVIWEFLLSDSVSWEAGNQLNKLIYKLAKDKKYSLKKRDSELFIDEMKIYVNFDYLEDVKPAKKASLYKELTEIIKNR
jgi:hypothetical protein